MGCALFRRRPALRHTHLLSSTDLIVSTNLCCRHESRGRGDQARHHMSGDGWMDGWVHQTLTGCGRVGRLRRPLGTSRLACLGQLLLRRVPKGVAGGPPVQGRVGQHHGARVAGVLLQRRPRPAADGRAGRRKVRTQGVAGGGAWQGAWAGRRGGWVGVGTAEPGGYVGTQERRCLHCTRLRCCSPGQRNQAVQQRVAVEAQVEADLAPHQELVCSVAAGERTAAGTAVNKSGLAARRAGRTRSEGRRGTIKPISRHAGAACPRTTHRGTWRRQRCGPWPPPEPP